MPMIIPALPFIGGAIGGLLGGKSRLSKEQQAAKAAQAQLAGKQTEALGLGIDTSKSLMPTATGFLDQARGAFTPAMDYWSRILSSRPEMTAALAPEIGRIASGYQKAGSTISQFAPRGGGRSSTLGELPYQQARDVSTLFSTLRPQAATALTDIGSRVGGLGGGLFGNILSMLSSAGGGAAGTNQSLFNMGTTGYNQGTQFGGALGGGIFDILKSLNLSSLFGKKSSGTGSTDKFKP